MCRLTQKVLFLFLKNHYTCWFFPFFFWRYLIKKKFFLKTCDPESNLGSVAEGSGSLIGNGASCFYVCSAQTWS